MAKLSVSDLIIIHCLKKPMYGLQLINQLKDIGVSISIGTIYSVLNRLRNKNLIKEIKLKSKTNHRQKYFQSTLLGQMMYNDFIELLKELNKNQDQ